MLKIRLQRTGRKHETTFRIVVTDSKNSTKSGRYKEILGSYDPRKATDLLKTDRIKHWLSQGARATDSIHNLLVNHKVIDARKKNVLPKKTYNPQPTTNNEPVIEAQAETAPEAQPEAAPEEASPAEAPSEAPTEEATPTE